MPKKGVIVRVACTAGFVSGMVLLALGQGTFVMPSRYADSQSPGGSDFPFTLWASPAYVPWRYQQFYEAGDMAIPLAPVYLTAMRFRLPEFAQNPLDITLPDVAIKLATAIDVNNTVFDENLGPDTTVVHARGPLHLSGSPGSAFTIEVPFEQPILIDKSRTAFLVMDVVNYQGDPTTRFVTLESSRVELDSIFSIGGRGQVQQITTEGLVTMFVYEPIPEPETWVLIALGAVCVCGAVRRPPERI